MKKRNRQKARSKARDKNQGMNQGVNQDDNRAGYDDCPLCQREMVYPSDHHLVPRSKQGRETVLICEDCHRAIHARFDTATLKNHYNTVERLLDDNELRGTIKFISKQNPHTKIKTKTSKSKQNRGR